MFDDIFAFSGRVGRLKFFLQGLVNGVCGGLALVVVLLLAYPARDQTMGLVFLGLCMIVLIPTMMWISFGLQTRRFRDIGWDPLYVIPAWIAICLGDTAVAHLYPQLTVGEHRGTIVGVLVNLFLSLALLFWPGRETNDFGSSPPRRVTRLENLGYDASRNAHDPPSPPARGPRTGFGRRNA